VKEVASAGGVVKTGGILKGQEPNIVWDHGRNRFQFLPVGSNNVSWLGGVLVEYWRGGRIWLAFPPSEYQRENWS
jgi:hypothetical protein